MNNSVARVGNNGVPPNSVVSVQRTDSPESERRIIPAEKELHREIISFSKQHSRELFSYYWLLRDAAEIISSGLTKLDTRKFYKRDLDGQIFHSLELLGEPEEQEEGPLVIGWIDPYTRERHGIQRYAEVGDPVISLQNHDD